MQIVRGGRHFCSDIYNEVPRGHKCFCATTVHCVQIESFSFIGTIILQNICLTEQIFINSAEFANDFRFYR